MLNDWFQKIRETYPNSEFYVCSAGTVEPLKGTRSENGLTTNPIDKKFLPDKHLYSVKDSWKNFEGTSRNARTATINGKQKCISKLLWDRKPDVAFFVDDKLATVRGIRQVFEDFDQPPEHCIHVSRKTQEKCAALKVGDYAEVVNSDKHCGRRVEVVGWNSKNLTWKARPVEGTDQSPLIFSRYCLKPMTERVCGTFPHLLEVEAKLKNYVMQNVSANSGNLLTAA